MSILWGQVKEVSERMVRRQWLMWKYKWLSTKRAFILFGVVQGIFYSVWLWSKLGWSRFDSYVSNYVRRIVFGILLVVLYIGLGGFDGIISMVYSWFTVPVMSEKGYMGYTVIASCIFVWFIQIGMYLVFKELIGPYKERLIMLNIVVLVLLLSLFAQVARIKFGIRVWYPNEREYGLHKSGLDFWDN